MTKRLRQVCKVALFVGLVMNMLRPPVAEAVEFQKRASINDPKNEVISTQGATITRTFPVEDGVVVQLVEGITYRLDVTGRYEYTSAGSAYLADAECSTYGSGSSWKSQRWTALAGGSDLLDLKAGQDITFDWQPVQPMSGASGEPACSATNTYSTTFVPPRGANYVQFYLHDPDPSDNNGTMSLTVTRGAFSGPRVFEGAGYQCPKWNETPAVGTPGETVGEIQHLTTLVDSFMFTAMAHPDEVDENGNHIYPYWYQSGHTGLYSCNWALQTSVYRITVEGTYIYNNEYPNAMADAECATGLADDIWFFERYPTNPRDPLAPYNDNLDMAIGKTNVRWIPNQPDASGMCSLDHKYYLPAWSPTGPGPIHFHLYDFAYEEWNNRGQLKVTVERIG